MDRLRGMEMLVRAAEAGSFARAAALMQIDPSAVSHAIAELEKELGLTLFYRTTRQLSLTEEGEEILERAGERRLVMVPRSLVTDDREGMIDAVLAGGGLTRIGMFDPALITSGRLRKVLAGWECVGGQPIYALYRCEARTAPKVVAFLEFVGECFAAFDPDELTLIHRPRLDEGPWHASDQRTDA